MHKRRLSRIHIQLSENHSPSPEQSNQKRHVWTCGDWPLLLGFIFVEQFSASLRSWSLVNGLPELLLWPHHRRNLRRKHRQTSFNRPHKSQTSPQHTDCVYIPSCFMCFLLFCEYIQTACSTCSSLRNCDTSINRIQCATTCCLDVCKHTQRVSSKGSTWATEHVYYWTSTAIM